MATCIYCRMTDAEVTFNTEHVMPRSLGTFLNSPVLTDVCKPCNSALDHNVEVVVTRGSLEGMERFLSGIRDADSVVKTPRNRVTFELDAPGWQGVQVFLALSEGSKAIKIMLGPQAMVVSKSGERRSIALADLTDPEPVRNAAAVWLYADGEEDQKRLVEAVERLGVGPKKWTDLNTPPSAEDGKVTVKFHAVYDDLARRLVAKIAFAFHAHVMGSQFVLKEEFDAIRRFIRYGEGRGSDLVRPLKKPILHEEKDGLWTFTDAHVVGIERAVPDGIVGRVALFNMIHNEIVLARRNPEVIYMPGLESGRLFHWRTKKIGELLPWDRTNLVQPVG